MTITNECNRQLMQRYPDNYFELAHIDAPYGINASKPTVKPNKIKQKNGTTLNVKTKIYKHKDWDEKPADRNFGIEVKRVSKNQIFWGANHFEWIVGKTYKPPRRQDFKDFIRKNPKGWILWDKLNGGSDQWDCEMAWTSYDFDSFIIPFMWSGMMQGSKGDGEKMEGNKQLNEKRVHPTQKPVRLYEKVYHVLLKVDALLSVLDTGIGSGSHGIACHNLNIDLTACELDTEYYTAAMKRIKEHKQQIRMF